MTKFMRRVVISIALAGLAVAIAILAWDGREGASLPVVSSPEPNEIHELQPHPTGKAPTTTETAASEARGGEKTAAEPFPLIAGSTVIQRARAGDVAAQFELFKALEYCRTTYGFYFGRDGRRRTLDQGLEFATTSSVLSVEQAREAYERCNAYYEGGSSLGNPETWLSKAAASGNYAASLELAKRDLLKAGQERVGEPSAQNAEKFEERLEAAKSLVRQGLKQESPDAIWMMADLQMYVWPNDLERADKVTWALRLVACDAGYDCSRSAEWVRDLCHQDYNCQPHEAGDDLILRFNGDRYPDLQVAANDLKERINTGDLGDLL